MLIAFIIDYGQFIIIIKLCLLSARKSCTAAHYRTAETGKTSVTYIIYIYFIYIYIYVHIHNNTYI